MITVSCRFAHSFKIMRIPHPIIPVRAPSQPVPVLWSGSADVIEVPYIRFLDGRVPKAFELFALADDGVCEVHPYARIKLRSEFREFTFQNFFFNARQFQIPFLGSRALNDSVEFIGVVPTTQNVRSRVDYTPNIFVHSWGVNLTDMISANVSTITRHAYDPIFSFHGFLLRSNHECLRLKRIELKRIRLDEYLARIRQDVRGDVAANARVPVNNALGDALSNDSDSYDGWLDIYESD